MRALLSSFVAVSLVAAGAVLFAPEAQALPQGDIVFMIDESGSMGADQADVQANVNAIAALLGASIDFQLGLVGFGDRSHLGAPCDGCAHIHQVLTNNVATFQAAVGGLTASGAFEPGFQATTVGMSAAMGFRQGAGVCAIIITDEDADVGGGAPETQAQALAALNARNATFFGIVIPNAGATSSQYGPNAGSLSQATGGAVFDLISFRNNPQPVLDAVIQACAQSITDFVLDPPTADNFLGSDHTVTASVELDGVPEAGTQVDFEVISGPNTGEASDPGECSVNGDCTTDAGGQTSWTYTGVGGLGQDEIEACIINNAGDQVCRVVVKNWLQPPCDNIEPHTQGFWRRVCKKAHPAQPDRTILTDELCEDLNPDPHSDPCERARSQCAALSYNLISDRLQDGCIDNATGGDVGTTAATAAALIAEGTNKSCKEAQALCGSINEGNVSFP